jgi:hypothetical protein
MFALGRAVRESGQALDRVGCRLQGHLTYVEQSELPSVCFFLGNKKWNTKEKKKLKTFFFFFFCNSHHHVRQFLDTDDWRRCTTSARRWAIFRLWRPMPRWWATWPSVPNSVVWYGAVLARRREPRARRRTLVDWRRRRRARLVGLAGAVGRRPSLHLTPLSATTLLVEAGARAARVHRAEPRLGPVRRHCPRRRRRQRGRHCRSWRRSSLASRCRPASTGPACPPSSCATSRRPTATRSLRAAPPCSSSPLRTTPSTPRARSSSTPRAGHARATFWRRLGSQALNNTKHTRARFFSLSRQCAPPALRR